MIRLGGFQIGSTERCHCRLLPPGQLPHIIGSMTASTIDSPSAVFENATALRATGLWKRFGNKDVVRGVSLRLDRGEVIGLVGPNGAGKTTTIRMLLDIVTPDSGSVTALGETLSAATRERIGYMPEERGLYGNLRVAAVLEYLGQLKGLSRQRAAIRTGEILETVGLSEHRTKKVRELSRGMTQLIQFAATLLHRPDIIVLDEPFSGLDPLNVRRMKDLVLEERRRGAAVIFSTHQMSDVEELSDRLMMINEGEVVLEGALQDIRRRYRSNIVRVESPDEPPETINGAARIERAGESYAIHLAPDATAEDVLRQLLDAGMLIERFEQAMPNLEEIFIRLVENG